jgi:uncharacterized short protein YbdD (DUF466 family)
LNVSQAVKGIRWYLREVTGEADYDRYLAQARRHHPGEPVLSRREFERRKMTLLEGRQNARCC